MKILSLNCQRGYQPDLEGFLHKTLQSQVYDFLLLQEASTNVREFLKHPSYNLLHAVNAETEMGSEVCIVYRSRYELADKGFQSFASMHKDPVYGFKHPCFSFIWGEFKTDNDLLRVGSIHLHAGIDSRPRIAELGAAKRQLLLKDIPTVLAGDLNAGFPGEAARAARLLSPGFKWISKGLGPTLDSRYSENVPHLPNRIAAFLGFFNMRIALRTDHFFVDSITAEETRMSCQILPDRVSDHSPIELIL
ncbi:MAG: endonuclease/exonuclease/phosphatase family protein [Patescibacteria group bacterium]